MKKSLLLLAISTALLLSACAEAAKTSATLPVSSSASSEAAISQIELSVTDSRNNESPFSFEQVSEPPISSDEAPIAVVPQPESQKQEPAAPSKPEKPTEVEPEPEAQPKAVPQVISAPASQPPAAPPAVPEPAPVDIGRYLDFARDYGTSIGLALDDTAVDCWDNPLRANSKSIYLERDIKDLLNWYKTSGFTAICVWSEDMGGGNYDLYIGYA